MTYPYCFSTGSRPQLQNEFEWIRSKNARLEGFRNWEPLGNNSRSLRSTGTLHPYPHPSSRISVWSETDLVSVSGRSHCGIRSGQQSRRNRRDRDIVQDCAWGRGREGRKDDDRRSSEDDLLYQ